MSDNVGDVDVHAQWFGREQRCYPACCTGTPGVRHTRPCRLVVWSLDSVGKTSFSDAKLAQ